MIKGLGSHGNEDTFARTDMLLCVSCDLIQLLLSQFADLKSDNSQLKEDNASLRDYIDGLLLTIIDKSPDALEVKPSMRSGRGTGGSRSSDNFTQ